MYENAARWPAIVFPVFAFYVVASASDRADCQILSLHAVAAPIGRQDASTQTPAGTSKAPPSATTKPATPSQHRETDVWFSLTIGGRKVGHRRLADRRIERAGLQLYETSLQERLRITRERNTIAVDIDVISRTTADGKLVEVEYLLPVGGQRVRMLGRVADGVMRIRPKDAAPGGFDLPWSTSDLGPFAVEHSLARKPMQPGEQRTLRVFAPSLKKVIRVDLRALRRELTSFPSGNYRLMRVEGRSRISENVELRSVLWVDARGALWKEEQNAGITIVAARTSRAAAIATSSNRPVDLFRRVMVPVDLRQHDPADAHAIDYNIMVRGADPAKLFSRDRRQRLRSLGRHKARLSVAAERFESTTDSYDSPDDQPAESPPKETDRLASSLVECDDPAIQALAASVGADENDPHTLAILLERLVFEYVEAKTYGQLFATAKEVCDSKEGDCTEHTTLLVALCRARGIPARAAMGLVYSPKHQAFAYHMWAEAWIGTRWAGLDGTLGRGRIGPTHLKMAQSSLSGPAAMTEMLVILQAIDGLKIEIVSVE